jgi:hypothetical protein
MGAFRQFAGDQLPYDLPCARWSHARKPSDLTRNSCPWIRKREPGALDRRRIVGQKRVGSGLNDLSCRVSDPDAQSPEGARRE